MLELIDSGLPDQCAARGRYLQEKLQDLGLGVRGRGLMLGVELGDASLRTARMLQQHGYIVLPAGQQAEVLCLTPPASITHAQIDGFILSLQRCLKAQQR
jgi:acetylornithine/succinyldiaminopimelate/putrescine aminotransferase